MYPPIRSAGFLLASCMCVSAAAAQQSRFSATPFVGYAWSTPIYDHSTYVIGFITTSRTSQRLATSAAPAAGARLEYHTGPSWSLYLEGSYSPTDVELVDTRALTGPSGPIDESFSRHINDASVTALTIAIARRFQSHDAAPLLALSVGGGWQRFSLEKRDRQCQPPSSGGIFCTPGDPWNPAYDFPTLVGALAASYDWTRRTSVEARVGYTMGRADTRGSQIEPLPEVDEYNARRKLWVRTTAVTLGITIRP